MELIDTHAHIWPEGLVHPAQQDLEPMHADASFLLRELADSQVSAAAISPSGIYLENDYVLKAALAHPSGLVGVVAVDPMSKTATAQLEQHHLGGAVGVQVVTPEGRAPLRPCASLAEFLNAAAGLGMFVQWSLPLKSSELVLWAGAQRSDLSLVMNHLALPEQTRGVESGARVRDLADIPRVILKVSGMYALSGEAFPYRDVWPWVEHVVDTFGSDRLMWGSDWPLSLERATYRQEVSLLDSFSFLSPSQRHRIGVTTAASLLGLTTGHVARPIPT